MFTVHARVAELADALDLKSSAEKRAGSSPASGTTSYLQKLHPHTHRSGY